jgi:hypothetical protein
LPSQLGQPIDHLVEVLFSIFFLKNLVFHHELGEDFYEFELFGVKWLQRNFLSFDYTRT